MCRHMNGTMGILHKYESVVHAFENVKIKLNQRQSPYAMIHPVIWWPFAMPLYHISTLPFSNDSINSCQTMQKQLSEVLLSKNVFLFLILNLSNRNNSWCKRHLHTVENTLFSSNVKTSYMNYSHLLQQNQGIPFPPSKSIEKWYSH